MTEEPAKTSTETITTVDDKAHIRHELDLTGTQWQRAEQGQSIEDAFECAFVPHTDGITYVAVRVSSNPDGPVMIFTPTEWNAFLAGIDDGEFDFS